MQAELQKHILKTALWLSIIWMLMEGSTNRNTWCPVVGHAADVIREVQTAVTEVTLLWLCYAALARFSHAHYIILGYLT